MSHYPILIDSSQIKALVIGAGEVGLRKIESLLMQDVQEITVYDTSLAFDKFKYKDNNYVTYFQKECDVSLLENYNLVFIASDNEQVNSFYVDECKKRKIFCNVITNPSEGTFTLPALIQKGDLLLTLSTNGLSPALTRALKADLENFIQDSYVEFCAFLGKVRLPILNLSLTSKENTEIFRKFVNEPQKHLFLSYFSDKSEKNKIKLEECIQSAFSSEVQKIIKEIL